jgi:CRP-like cAMP-binding protein/FAD/FMN-containing dehydrogenase
VEAGETVIVEGAPSHALGIVESGTVSIHVGELEVADRPEGTWFGELGLLMGGRASATVRAREPSRMAWFDGEALDAFILAHPGAAGRMLFRISEQLASRIRTADLRSNEAPPAILGALWSGVARTVVRVFSPASKPVETPSAAELSGVTGWPVRLTAPLAPSVRVARFADGELVVREGETTALSDSVWLVADGFGLVVRGGESVRMLGRGDWFGLISWAIGTERSASVRAAGTLRALAIPFGAVAEIERSHPEVYVALLRRFAAQLATDAALYNARLAPRPVPAAPRPVERVTLTSYGGWQSCEAERRIVHDVDQARAALAETRGHLVTLRSAGLSFDQQALGTDVVLGLSDLDTIRLDSATGQVRVGAAARWGDIVLALDGTGLMPPVVVSASDATVGGTLSANSLSRFTPIWGKEGKSIRSLQLLCADGQVRVCSRQENPALFHAAVAGWGSMGIVLGATYQLKAVPVPTRVCTRVERRPDLEGLSQLLLPSADADETVYALIAFSGGAPRVLLSRARYSPDAADTMLPHRPASPMRVPVEWAINRFAGAGQAFWNFAYDYYVREDRPYVDELSGYTFFQDGNVRSRDTAARIGLDFRLVQQAFVIPETIPGLLERFILEAEARLRIAGFHTALVDSLYLPPDEPFALSSTRDGGGYAVTLTYEGNLDFPKLVLELERLSADLALEGGRVHLVKNVFASPDVMCDSYANGLAQWRRAKAEWDPEGRFGSAFLRRVFGEGAGQR